MKDANLLINNGVNVQKSLELFGDMETYDDTLETFLEEVEVKLAKIKRFKEIADMKNYAVLVHSLKSDARYFGFEKLAELAYQHELESKANNMYYVSDNYNELMLEAIRIIRLVKQYLGKPVTSEITVNDTEILHDKAILVADDSNIVSNFIKKIFNDSYDVLIAGDGNEAIEIIKNHSGKKIVGMLLDLNMPNVDGFAVLEYLKVNGLFSEIPVSIITGDSSKEVIQKAFTYPIVDMLQKPFNELNIKNIVERTIAQQR
ncbi:MAG: response regulator [Firmicutes bacterium]|nr:response regulator [Bacillota bacterium]